MSRLRQKVFHKWEVLKISIYILWWRYWDFQCNYFFNQEHHFTRNDKETLIKSTFRLCCRLFNPNSSYEKCSSGRTYVLHAVLAGVNFLTLSVISEANLHVHSTNIKFSRFEFYIPTMRLFVYKYAYTCDSFLLKYGCIHTNIQKYTLIKRMLES